jgi:hypothetical protein
MVEILELSQQRKKTGANKGFAIVGRNCKVQRISFGSTFLQN